MPNQPTKGQLKRIAIQKGEKPLPNPKYKIWDKVWIAKSNNSSFIIAEEMIWRVIAKSRTLFFYQFFDTSQRSEAECFPTLEALLDSLKQNAIPYKGD